MANTLEYWSKRLAEFENDILPDNYRHLKRHIRRMESNGSREMTIVHHVQMLIPFACWCKIPFQSLTEDDLFDYNEFLADKTYHGRKYTKSTLYAHKAVIKTFLKGVNKELAVSMTLKKAARTLPEVLTEKEVTDLIRVARNSRDRALISCLYESGARKGEILSVRIKHITFDENGCVVVLPQGKTGPRRIRLIYSAGYLSGWISDHPTRDDRESIVFCSLQSPFPKLSDTGLHNQLRKLAGWAGIKKKLTAHSFRHAAATHFAKLMTEQEMKIYFGWTAGSTMAATYVHLSGEDLDDSILQIHGLKSQTQEKSLSVTRCPRCKDIIPGNSAYCGKCGLPLQDSIKQKIEHDIAEIDIDIIKAALLNPAILEEIAKRVKQNELTG